MKIKTNTFTTHSIEVDELQSVLSFEPVTDDSVLTHVAGDKLVVAYLVQDSDPQNPMEGDCQGVIYTMPSRGWGGGSITDDAYKIHCALGVDGYGEVDFDKPFMSDGRPTCLRDIAALQYLEVVGQDLELMEQMMEQLREAERWELAVGETFEQAFAEHRDEILGDLEDASGTFCDEVEALATSLYPKYWQQIAGPWVVPLAYCSSNHGPGTMSISPTTWDGGPDNLPTGVWVADKGAIDNITPYPDGVELKQVVCWPAPSVYAVVKGDIEVFRGPWADCRAWAKVNLPKPDDADLRTAACKYAESICSSYEAWCNGDVYGCVVQTFEKQDGGWVELDEDSCWGFIGSDHAKMSLESDFFNPAVGKIKK